MSTRAFSSDDFGPQQPTSVQHSGETIRLIVLGCFASELALVIGARGAAVAILLLALASWFWWIGYGRHQTDFDAFALGNAIGIMGGISFGFPQLLLPVLIASVAILVTSISRIAVLGKPGYLAPLLTTACIAFTGSAALSIHLTFLPF